MHPIPIVVVEKITKKKKKKIQPEGAGNNLLPEN